LILLAGIDRFDLLHDIYGEILVPDAVWRETVAAGTGRVGAIEARGVFWIHRKEPPNPSIVSDLAATLDPGEAEAIALALSLQADMPVLLDDRRARRVAADAGLKVTGTAGVLVEAKRLGLIPLFAPLLAELREAGLYLSEIARERLIDLAGES
jgi:predicted nucleic acid-binding protein